MERVTGSWIITVVLPKEWSSTQKVRLWAQGADLQFPLLIYFEWSHSCGMGWDLCGSLLSTPSALWSPARVCTCCEQESGLDLSAPLPAVGSAGLCWAWVWASADDTQSCAEGTASKFSLLKKNSASHHPEIPSTLLPSGPRVDKLLLRQTPWQSEPGI